MQEQELSFQVIIKPDLEKSQKDVVAFGDFEVESEGAAFQHQDLAAFFEQLFLGRPFPLVFVTRKVTLPSLVAIALFLNRDLAIQPSTPNLVYSVELVDRYGLAGLAQLDRDLADFLQLLSGFFPENLARTEQGRRLEIAVDWIRGYLQEGALPANPHTGTSSMPSILDVGTNGFVVASISRGDLESAWIELYRLGYLRGVLLTFQKDRLWALGAKKSPYLQLDLRQAAEILNEAERAMGEPPEWRSEPLWLRSPEGGTELPAEAIVEVLVRV